MALEGSVHLDDDFAADIASALELLTLEAWHTCWSAEFQDADGSLSSASQDLNCDGTSLSNKMASPTIA